MWSFGKVLSVSRSSYCTLVLLHTLTLCSSWNNVICLTLLFVTVLIVSCQDQACQMSTRLKSGQKTWREYFSTVPIRASTILVIPGTTCIALSERFNVGQRRL